MQSYTLTYKPDPFLRGNPPEQGKKQVKKRLSYSTFGAPMPGLTYQANVNYRFGQNGQEKEDEIFKGAYTAEFWEYDARLGRRWNVDPVIKSWQSGYTCFSGNPIIMIDPKGASDFYNQMGKKVGTDGVDDGKIYVLTNQADVKRARRSYFGRGLKGFFNLLTGNGGKGTIQMSEFKGDVVGLPSANVRAKIGDAVDRSKKPAGDDTQGKFHEEGGIFGTNADGIETVVNAKPGGYSDPQYEAKATIDVFEAANPAEAGTIINVQGTFHIHPAGISIEDVTPRNEPGVTSQTKQTQVHTFNQPPSLTDVELAVQGGNTSGYNIVVGTLNNTVYIYGTSGTNQPGTNYRATFPLDVFRKIGNEKKTQ